MTPERLDEIRGRANLQCGLDGDDADDLLIHVDHLTAENARLRAGIEALISEYDDPKDDLMRTPDYYSGLDTASCDLADLLNPPTEGTGP